MSWMDSWSRPSANSKVPAPLYLASNDVPYCHSCGRIMTTKKSPKRPQEIKYCSDRCRGRKPGPKDRVIEHKIAALLNGEEESGIEGTAAKSRVIKGDPRMVITVDEVEAVMFGSRFDPTKIYGRNKNKKSRFLREEKEWRTVDMESSSSGSSSDSDGDDADADAASYSDPHLDEAHPSRPASNSSDSHGGVPIPIPFQISHIRPPQLESEINFSAGGGERSKSEKIAESESDLAKRREGAKRAEEREMVRRAARRVIVFGVEVAKVEREVSSRKDVKERSRRGKRGGQGMDDGDDEVVEGKGKTEVRKAEALMNGIVVEPSFAKGNWSIRWRE